MSANLTIQYHKAEQAYRQATSPEEELRCLEVMLRELPKHKGTDKLQADLKQKISRAKKESLETKSSGNKRGFRLPRQGAGRAVIVGPANSGKSQLLASMTRATPDVAGYPFTTREPQPGMMPWEDILIQLVDTPPVTADVFDPRVQALIRGADVAILMVDLGDDDGGQQMMETFQKINSTKTRLGKRSYLDPDDLGTSYAATLLVFNKSDLDEAADRLDFFNGGFPESVKALDQLAVSASEKTNLEKLGNWIHKKLDVVRVYTKSPAKREADFDKPYTLNRGSTLADLADLIHKDIAKNFKSARIWSSDVHDGIIVNADYMINDKDVVEIRT